MIFLECNLVIFGHQPMKCVPMGYGCVEKRVEFSSHTSRNKIYFTLGFFAGTIFRETCRKTPCFEVEFKFRHQNLYLHFLKN